MKWLVVPLSDVEFNRLTGNRSLTVSGTHWEAFRLGVGLPRIPRERGLKEADLIRNMLARGDAIRRINGTKDGN
jgi:hypothetical protein